MRKKLFCFLLLLVSAQSLAVPVEWTLNEVVLLESVGNETTLTGSFTYDADTNTFFVIVICIVIIVCITTKNHITHSAEFVVA